MNFRHRRNERKKITNNIQIIGAYVLFIQVGTLDDGQYKAETCPVNKFNRF
jgi:hypothetical protein